jgi:hypothetical protein
MNSEAEQWKEAHHDLERELGIPEGVEIDLNGGTWYDLWRYVQDIHQTAERQGWKRSQESFEAFLTRIKL